MAVCHLLVGQEEIPGRDKSKHESSGWAVHSQDECLPQKSNWSVSAIESQVTQEPRAMRSTRRASADSPARGSAKNRDGLSLHTPRL